MKMKIKIETSKFRFETRSESENRLTRDGMGWDQRNRSSPYLLWCDIAHWLPFSDISLKLPCRNYFENDYKGGNHKRTVLTVQIYHYIVRMQSWIKKTKAGLTAIQSRKVKRKPLGIQKCDGRTDGPTDTARCSVACPRLMRQQHVRRFQ